MHVALVSLGLTWVAMGTPPVAATGQLPLDLTWSAPLGCPTVDEEREEIRRRAGDVSAAAERVIAEVVIAPLAEGGFRLSLRTRVGTTAGERLLTGPDCRPLGDAAAMVLALLINPDAPLGPPPPPPPLPPPPPPPAPASPEPRLAVGVDAIAGTGVLPGRSTGFALRGMAQRSSLAIGARLLYFLPRDTAAPLLADARATFDRAEAALAACAATRPSRRIGGAACAGAAVVRLHGESAGVSAPATATATWVEGLAELAGHLHLARHLRLRLAVDGRALGSPPDFAILGLGSAYRPSATSLRAAVGMDALF